MHHSRGQMRFNHSYVTVVCLFAVMACGPKLEPYEFPDTAAVIADAGNDTDSGTQTAVEDIFTVADRLGKGVNLAHWMEAPAGQDWGEYITEVDFQNIAGAGFDTVRLPIRWEDYALESAPFTIAEEIFTRVGNHIRYADNASLNLVINMHHHNRLFESPQTEGERFWAMWEQIALRFMDVGNHVYFELMNEPHGNLTPDAWNTLAAAAVLKIRETNPTRPIIVGTAEWGGLGALQQLVMPDDPNLIMTFHYYEPYAFTHQGAMWAQGSNEWLGMQWTGSFIERLEMANAIGAAGRFAEENQVPVWIGEFGAIEFADITSRALWAETFARMAEDAGMTWAYWDYSANFGLYDNESDQWHGALLEALMGDDFGVTELNRAELGPDLLAGENGDFSDGFTDWGRSSASNRMRLDDEIFHLMISNPGTERWDIQLYHELPLLEADHGYAILFDAKSSQSRAIGVSIQNFTEEKDWQNYAYQDVNISPEWQTYVIQVHMTESDADAAVAFNMGIETADVFLDNVMLVEVP